MNAYGDITWGAAPADRPHTMIIMVCTLDGKSITGERDEAIMDLGSDADRETMRSVEKSAQAVLIGAGTLRATKGLWYPQELYRFVATNDPNLPVDGRFFSDAPEKAFIVSHSGYAGSAGVNELLAGSGSTDWRGILSKMRTELGIERLLIEGGSTLNGELLRLRLIDEILLTMSPKLKLGDGVPTIAGGIPFDRDKVQTWTLAQMNRIGDEVFLRYRKPSQ